jgi:hypothetical protein
MPPVSGGRRMVAVKKKLKVSVTAQMNARLQPMHRGHFEDPLYDLLEQQKIGALSGGGTQLAEEPYGIAYCDICIDLADASQATLDVVIGELNRLGAPKGSKLILDKREIPFGVHEGLALFLNGMDLPDEVYASSDINHVIEECERLMAVDGKMLSFWEGSRETALYFYGPSFAKMKAAIEPFLASYPLCQRCRIEQIA